MLLTFRVIRTTLPTLNKGVYSGFETRSRRHQRSKTGVSGAQKQDLCAVKIKNQNNSWKVAMPRFTENNSLCVGNHYPWISNFTFYA